TSGAGLKVTGAGGGSTANKQTFSSGFGFSTVTYIGATAGKSIIVNSVSATGFGTGGHHGIFNRRIDFPAADPAVPTSTIVWDLVGLDYECQVGNALTCQVIGGGGLTSGAYDVSCTYSLI